MNKMTITPKMLNEIECLKYFILSSCNWSRITKPAIIKYFEWSTQGKHKKLATKAEIPHKKYTGFETLIWANTWRNRHIYEMYEPAVNDLGYLCAGFIDETVPRVVIDYLKKTMFRGQDKQIIERIYNIGGIDE
jgi:hypothetical protein